MIQRIQSLWLLGSAACAGFFAYLPIFIGTFIGGAEKKCRASENLILFTGVCIICAISLVNIFFYKKRSRQKMLIVVNILLTAAVFVLQYFLIEALKKEEGMASGNWQIAAILPVFIIMFHVFAYKAISQDEALLNSADRMR
jgi:uncharacterized membrane protein